MNKLKEIKRLVTEVMEDHVHSVDQSYAAGLDDGRFELAEEILEILNGEQS